jgi:hypothetical protein
MLHRSSIALGRGEISIFRTRCKPSMKRLKVVAPKVVYQPGFPINPDGVPPNPLHGVLLSAELPVSLSGGYGYLADLFVPTTKPPTPRLFKERCCGGRLEEGRESLTNFSRFSATFMFVVKI